MIYSFTLQQVAIALGIWYILSHGLALWQPELCKKWLQTSPRNYPLGVVLMSAACLWFCWLIFNADLMDFAPYQSLFLIISVALGLGTIVFVREFLSVRALGALLLLFANVLLDAAFLENEYSKLVITLTAYVYIIAGIALVAWPYLLRDLITWVYQTNTRARLAASVGVIFGVLLLTLGILVY